MTTELPAEVHLAWGAASHRGARRLLNEDRFLVSRSVFFVADGMGGHEAGEVASATAVEALRPLADLDVVTPDEVRDRIAVAQENVQAIVTEPGRGAGTTVTGVVVSEQDGNPYWLVVNVGDSRTYHLAGGRLEQVSVDHSEVQEMVDAGLLTPAEALTHPRRHVVTRALGSRNASAVTHASLFRASIRPQFRGCGCCWKFPAAESSHSGSHAAVRRYQRATARRRPHWAGVGGRPSGRSRGRFMPGAPMIAVFNKISSSAPHS